VVVANLLQEESIMNFHIHDHISSEHTLEIMRSIEFFVVIIVAASIVGIVCMSVA